MMPAPVAARFPPASGAAQATVLSYDASAGRPRWALNRPGFGGRWALNRPGFGGKPRNPGRFT